MSKISLKLLFILAVIAVAHSSFAASSDTSLVAGTAGSQSYTDTITGMDFVSVPGGCFQMGSSLGRETPEHKVCVDSFLIGKFEVTQAQWLKIMDSNPSTTIKEANHPVDSVNWDDTQEFISRLNKKSGKTYRLPTEAEWEYAARGGDKSKNYKYSGSDKIDEVAWYLGNSERLTYPGGKKQANELGVYDMSGNVWEWCQDYYDKNYYQTSPTQNPKGPANGSYRVMRGGSWNMRPNDETTVNRQQVNPADRDPDHGFRLVLPSEPEQAALPQK